MSIRQKLKYSTLRGINSFNGCLFLYGLYIVYIHPFPYKIRCGDRIKNCFSRFFEQLVVDLLVTMGYGGSLKDAGEAVGQSGDEGIDGIIKEDKLGLDATA